MNSISPAPVRKIFHLDIDDSAEMQIYILLIVEQLLYIYFGENT